MAGEAGSGVEEADLGSKRGCDFVSCLFCHVLLVVMCYYLCIVMDLAYKEREDRVMYLEAC